MLIRNLGQASSAFSSRPEARQASQRVSPIAFAAYHSEISINKSIPSVLSSKTPDTIPSSNPVQENKIMSLKRKAADAANAAKKSKPNASITSFFGAPKVTSKVETNFSKDEWVAGLTDEQKDLLKLEIDTLHDSWLPHVKDVLVSEKFLDLKRFLKQELAAGKTVYPPMRDVYSW